MNRWAWKVVAVILWIALGFPAFLIVLPVRVLRQGGWLHRLGQWLQTPYAIARRKSEGWSTVGHYFVRNPRRHPNRRRKS